MRPFHASAGGAGVIRGSEKTGRTATFATEVGLLEPTSAVGFPVGVPIGISPMRPLVADRSADQQRVAARRTGDDKRLHDIAVFAGRGPVPQSAFEALWISQGCSTAETESLVADLVDRSIVKRDRSGLLLIDEGPAVTGDGSATPARGMAAAHGRLVDGYRSRCPGGSWPDGPNDGYYFANIAYHMAQANRTRELHHLLLDYEWLRAKLAVAGIIGLLGDFAQPSLPADAKAVDNALASSVAELAARPDRLASQLAGGLVGLSSPGIDRLIAQIRDRAPRPWICPVTPAPYSTTGVLERDLPRHDGVVRSLAVTSDGRRIVSGGDDHTIRVWDMASGHLIHAMHGHADAVRAVALTPDDRRIVSGGLYDVVRVWDLETGQFLHSIAGYGGFRAVHSVAVTSDGDRVVWGGAGATVQVWDTANGRIEHVLKSQDHVVRSLVTTPDGKFVLSCGDAGLVQIWNLSTGRLVRVLNGKSRPAYSIAVTPDGNRIITGGHDYAVRVWDFASGRLEQTLWGHAAVVDAVAVTPDGSRIISCGGDRKVLTWDLSSGREVASWKPAPDTDVTAVCPFPTDPSRIACGDSAGFLHVLQLLQA
jgi:WD40 repeat protein